MAALRLLLLAAPALAYEITPCPGITGSEASDAQSSIDNPIDQEPGDCLCVPSTQYNISCPAGFFCPSSGGQFKCTAGFYCPVNVSQPAFCCAGYYCPDASQMIRCPEGSFCPIGVEKAVSCPFGSECPEGTTDVSSNAGAVIGIIVIFLVLWICVCCQKRVKRFHGERRYGTVQEFSHDPKLLSRAEFDAQFTLPEDSETKKVDVKRKSLEEKQMDDPVAEGKVQEGKADPKKALTFDILYKDITLTLSNGRTIMKGASGRFRAGRTCAIMGPSGAGKTTLVTLVMGKAKRTDGTVYINGKQDEMYHYRDEIGFVPQEDIMQRNLTVWDILKFSADYRLPKEFSQKARQEECYRVLKFLEIEHIVNSVIGDEKTRGISGGQRKRVNIGMELVAKPKFLVLDEPTSGLDSVTSLTLASLLQTIARETGISVAAIIHSPSPDTFDKFDDFTLLGVGGTVLYSGERERALEYFESVGFTKPKKMTPADFYLEVSMGRVPRKLDDGRIDVDFDIEILPALWVTYGRDYRSDELKDLPDIHGSPDKESSRKETEIKSDDTEKMIAKKSGFSSWMQKTNRKMKTNASNEWHSIENYVIDCASEFWNWISCKSDGNRKKANFFQIFFICGRRTYFQMYREGSWVWGLFLHVALGLFVGVLITNQFVGPLPVQTCEDGPLQALRSCVLPLQDIYMTLGVFSCWISSFAGMIEGIYTFGAEQVVFWRHTARGLPTIPYFLAKVASDVPKMLINSALFFAGMTLVYFPLGDRADLYGLILVNYWVGYTFGYFVSMIFEPRLRSLWCVIFAMAYAFIFSGFTTTLPNIEDQYGKGLEWLWDMSYMRWGLEAFYVNQMAFYEFLENINSAFSTRNYNPDNFAKNCWIIFGLGLFWLFITFLCLKGCNRTKQK